MENVFKLSEYDRIKAKSWADYLFRHAPQTAMYFDKSISYPELLYRQRQLKKISDQGLPLQELVALNYFRKANISSIIRDIRPSFNQYMEFSFKRGACSLRATVSPTTMLYYVRFLLNQVYEKEITPETFHKHIYHMRIFASMANATEGLPKLNIDKLTIRETQKVNEYVASAS